LAEQDVWLRQDYRQAFICISLAERGERDPFVASSYRIYGTHPDKVWPKIMRNRRVKLGKEFPDFYDDAGNLKPDVPKKPSQFNLEAERATNERLAALLMFPIKGVQRANVEQTGCIPRTKTGKGTLYEMPQASRPEASQPLRILPA